MNALDKVSLPRSFFRRHILDRGNSGVPGRAPVRLLFEVWLGLVLVAVALTASEPTAPPSQEDAAPEAEVGSEVGDDWFWDVSVGIESARGPSLPSDRAFDHRLFGLEPGEMNARYRRSSAAAFEASIGYRVQGRLAIAVALSRSSHDVDVDVAAELPHPFFFSRPRSVEGAVGAARGQLSLHVSAMWRIREGKRLEFALFGGPSWFEYDEEIVVGLEFESEYPYDEAELTGGEILMHSSVTAGLHLGAQVAWWFRPRAGLLGTVRHVYGPDEFELPDGTRLDLDAGGLQALVGIRYRF